MDQWFPHLRQDGNIMRLAFCVPDTSRQFDDFEHDRPPSMVGQMRGALTRWPDNTRLTQLITDVLAANSHARRLWDQPVVRIHADGERRRLYLPDTGQTRHIKIVALNLMRSDHLHMIMLKPISDRPDAGPAAKPDAEPAAACPRRTDARQPRQKVVATNRSARCPCARFRHGLRVSPGGPMPPVGQRGPIPKVRSQCWFFGGHI